MSRHFIHLVSVPRGPSGSREAALAGGLFHSFGVVTDAQLQQIRDRLRDPVFVSCYHQTVQVSIAAITSDPTEVVVLERFFSSHDESRDADMIAVLLSLDADDGDDKDREKILQKRANTE